MVYADPSEVAPHLGREFSDSDSYRAQSLVVAASKLLDLHVTINPDDKEQLDLARIVVIDMVTEALVPGEHRGHQSYSWRNGALAGSGTLVGTAGALRLLDWHVAMFGAPSSLSPSWYFGDGGRA